MFFAVKVNFALAALGVNPQVVKTTYRQAAQEFGKQVGHSPEEVALYIAAQMPLAIQLEMKPGCVRKWLRQRKINPKDSAVREAIYALQWDELLVYE